MWWRGKSRVKTFERTLSSFFVNILLRSSDLYLIHNLLISPSLIPVFFWFTRFSWLVLSFSSLVTTYFILYFTPDRVFSSFYSGSFFIYREFFYGWTVILKVIRDRCMGRSIDRSVSIRLFRLDSGIRIL